MKPKQQPTTAQDYLSALTPLVKGGLRQNFIANYINGCLIIAQAYCLAHIVDGVVFQGHDWGMVSPLIYGVLAIFFARYLMTSMAGYASDRAATRVQDTIRRQLYDRITMGGSGLVARHGSGALVNHIVEGVEAIGKYYQDYLPTKSVMMAAPLTILAFVFPFDWLSGVVMIVTAPLIPVFMILIGKKAESLNQKQWKQLARMGNYFMDAVQGLTTLQLFNAAQRQSQSIKHVSDTYRRDTMGVLRVAFLSSVTLEFFATVSIAVVAVLIGFRLLWGEMAFFNGFFVLMLAPEFYLPLRKMGGAYHAKMESVAAMDKMMDLLDITPEQGADKPSTKGTTSNTQSLPCDIAFHAVSLTYDGDRPAIHDIDFHIASGTHLAIIGPSGAGKSTIFSLLLGFIEPNAGQIVISNQPMDKVDLNWWRANISWIPQNPTLFYGTVLDNIRLGNRAASDDDIYALCRTLGIDDFINGLPQGYQTHVGEKGYGLSGGQIQRLAIARAFLRDAPIVLMDEPTASLDYETESIIQRAMQTMTAGKTVITIAHRLHTIQSADHILVLNQGQVVAQGCHDDLIQSDGGYQSLIQTEITHPIQPNMKGSA